MAGSTTPRLGPLGVGVEPDERDRWKRGASVCSRSLELLTCSAVLCDAVHAESGRGVGGRRPVGAVVAP